MNNLVKNVAIWVVIALVLMAVFNQFSSRQAAQSVIPYSQFMDEVKQGRVNSASVEGRTVRWLSQPETSRSRSSGTAWGTALGTATCKSEYRRT